MRQAPTPLNNEERFLSAIIERLDAILDVLKPAESEPVKAQAVEPVKAPEPAKAPAPKRKKPAKKE